MVMIEPIYWSVLSWLPLTTSLLTLRQPMSDALRSFADSSPAPDDSLFETSVVDTGHQGGLHASHGASSNIPQSGTSPSLQQPLIDGGQIPTPSRWNDIVLFEQNSSERQTAMLRFRYQIVPWLDANAARSTFGPKMMILAAEKSIIMELIIWVAMRRSESTGQDIEHQRIEQLQHRLSLEDGFVNDVGQSLLALSRFFHTCPSAWTSLYSDAVSVRHRYHFFGSQEEPLQTLDRFHFKTGTLLCHLDVVILSFGECRLIPRQQSSPLPS